MLLPIAIALALADLATTLVGVRMAGSESEDNPLWRRVIARRGAPAFAIAYLAGAGSIVLLASWLGQEALLGLVAVLALVVLNNLYAIARMLAR
jgi:hypothetical protein